MVFACSAWFGLFLRAILEDTCFDGADSQILDANISFCPQHIVGVPTELTEENERLAAALPVEP